MSLFLWQDSGCCNKDSNGCIPWLHPLPSQPLLSTSLQRHGLLRPSACSLPPQAVLITDFRAAWAREIFSAFGSFSLVEKADEAVETQGRWDPGSNSGLSKVLCQTTGRTLNLVWIQSTLGFQAIRKHDLLLCGWQRWFYNTWILRTCSNFCLFTYIQIFSGEQQTLQSRSYAQDS